MNKPESTRCNKVLKETYYYFLEELNLKIGHDWMLMFKVAIRIYNEHTKI